MTTGHRRSLRRGVAQVMLPPGCPPTRSPLAGASRRQEHSGARGHSPQAAPGEAARRRRSEPGKPMATALTRAATASWRRPAMGCGLPPLRAVVLGAVLPARALPRLELRPRPRAPGHRSRSPDTRKRSAARTRHRCPGRAVARCRCRCRCRRRSAARCALRAARCRCASNGRLSALQPLQVRDFVVGVKAKHQVRARARAPGDRTPGDRTTYIYTPRVLTTGAVATL